METKPTKVKEAPGQAMWMEGLGLGLGQPAPESVLGCPLMRAEETPAPDNRQETTICSGNVSWTPLVASHVEGPGKLSSIDTGLSMQISWASGEANRRREKHPQKCGCMAMCSL